MGNGGGFVETGEGLEGTVIFARDARAQGEEYEKGSKPSPTLPESTEELRVSGEEVRVMSGLSRLQKAILKSALENRAYLNSDQVILARDGLCSIEYWMKQWGLDLMLSDVLSLANTSSKRAAQASICRAFNRLESRGLVERHCYGRGSGIKVTPMGEAMVNNFPPVGDC